jgi:pyruvate dehydrogenase E1 component alpha subunit
VCAALNQDDTITSTHRGHGHCISKGGDMAMMMAELLGKDTGYCHGKGGSMHIADVDKGILGANGIVGGGMGIATGAGLSAKLLGNGRVSVCFFGDGALNQGILHESMNLASIWKLPVIYVCENNRYAMGTSLERALAQTEIYKYGEAYKIPSEPVDGMDVLAIREAITRAVERARKDKAPTLVEARTYRFRGHSMRDPAGAVYRTKEEVEREKLRDPIVLFRDKAVAAGLLTDADVRALEKDVNDIIDEAVAFADASPEPPSEWLFTDIYKD